MKFALLIVVFLATVSVVAAKDKLQRGDSIPDTFSQEQIADSFFGVIGLTLPKGVDCANTLFPRLDFPVSCLQRLTSLGTVSLRISEVNQNPISLSVIFEKCENLLWVHLDQLPPDCPSLFSKTKSEYFWLYRDGSVISFCTVGKSLRQDDSLPVFGECYNSNEIGGTTKAIYIEFSGIKVSGSRHSKEENAKRAQKAMAWVSFVSIQTNLHY